MTQAEFDFDSIKFGDTPSPLPDPEPKPKTPRVSKTGNGRGPGRPSKANAIKELQEEIEGFLMLTAMPLKMRDTHDDGSSCADMFIDFNAGKLTPEAQNWANALATVGVDNKYIQKFFTLGDGAGKWLQLAMATQPFILGIAGNHFMRGNHGIGTGEMV